MSLIRAGDSDEAPGHDGGQLGERVHQFRRLRRMSLRELGELSDVSPSFLSQLENGRSSASIATLARIAAGLRITIGDLFANGTIGPEPLRAGERPVLRAEDNVRKTLLTQAHLRGMALYGGQFGPGGSTGPDQYSHPGSHEVVVVVRGHVVVELNEARHVLGVGDSIEFDSAHPHRIVNETDEDAEVHWIVGPQQPAFPKRRRKP